MQRRVTVRRSPELSLKMILEGRPTRPGGGRRLVEVPTQVRWWLKPVLGAPGTRPVDIDKAQPSTRVVCPRRALGILLGRVVRVAERAVEGEAVVTRRPPCLGGARRGSRVGVPVDWHARWRRCGWRARRFRWSAGRRATARGSNPVVCAIVAEDIGGLSHSHNVLEELQRGTFARVRGETRVRRVHIGEVRRRAGNLTTDGLIGLLGAKAVGQMVVAARRG